MAFTVVMSESPTLPGPDSSNTICQSQWSSWCKDDGIVPTNSPVNRSISTTSLSDNPLSFDVKMFDLHDSTSPSAQQRCVSSSTYANCKSRPGSTTDKHNSTHVESLEILKPSASLTTERFAQHNIPPSQMQERYLFNSRPEFTGYEEEEFYGENNHALYYYRPSAIDDIWNKDIQTIANSSLSASVATNIALDCFNNNVFSFDEPPRAKVPHNEASQEMVSFLSDWNPTEQPSDLGNLETTSRSFVTNMTSTNGFYAFIDTPQEVRARRDNAQRREIEDRFLLNSRAAGMSFKVIKEQGRFNVAESTLRGRYRALTKEKRDREREPKWTEKDIRALRNAFDREKANHGDNFRWNRVAEMMTYPYTTRNFAAQTCSKKWKEIRKG